MVLDVSVLGIEVYKLPAALKGDCNRSTSRGLPQVPEIAGSFRIWWQSAGDGVWRLPQNKPAWPYFDNAPQGLWHRKTRTAKVSAQETPCGCYINNL